MLTRKNFTAVVVFIGKKAMTCAILIALQTTVAVTERIFVTFPAQTTSSKTHSLFAVKQLLEEVKGSAIRL